MSEELCVLDGEENMEWLADGMAIGRCGDSGKRVTVPWDDWMRHGAILGQPGEGKTMLGEFLAAQQIMAGGGLLWLSAYPDPDCIRFLRNALARAGRPDDLLVVNPGKPSESNTYNPVLFGDPDEVADRIMSLLPASENNPGADFYRQSAKQALTTLVGAIQKTGKPYNALDLVLFLMDGKQMLDLCDLLEYKAANAWGEEKKGIEQASQDLNGFLDQYMIVSEDGAKTLDMKRIKETFGGIAGRLYAFGSGGFGSVTGAYQPDVDMFEAIRAGKVVCIQPPSMGKMELALGFCKLVVSDYCSAISRIQELPEEKRPSIPFLSFFDEASVYASPGFSLMFENLRAARVPMVSTFQTSACYKPGYEELREMFVGNAWTKIFFKSDTSDPCFAAGLMEQEVSMVSAGVLGKLNNGECIVVLGGKNAYHVKVPRLRFDPKFEASLGPVRINQFQKSPAVNATGFNLFDKMGKDRD